MNGALWEPASESFGGESKSPLSIVSKGLVANRSRRGRLRSCGVAMLNSAENSCYDGNNDYTENSDSADV